MPAISPSWHDAWWQLTTKPPASLKDHLLLGGLRAASAAYGTAVWLRNAAYDSGRVKPVELPACVISIGNLTLGGTGKTACVMLVARKLSEQGRRVGVLSRGYGGAKKEYWLKQHDGELWVDGRPWDRKADLADEPVLLAEALKGMPVLVGPKRSVTGDRACRQLNCDTLLLDDGFQHRQLLRDCDIVLVHARMPLGGWPVFPQGPMREPVAALKRAQVIVITKADENLEKLNALQEQLHRINPEALIVTSVHAPTAVRNPLSGWSESPKQLAGCRVGLVSSIGDPEGFEATLRRLDAAVVWHKAFPDHHLYTAEDLEAIAAWSRKRPVQRILTTEKDWMRLKPRLSGSKQAQLPNWNVLAVEMQLLSGEDKLDARLASVCSR